MNTLMFLWIFFVIKCALSTFVGCGQWRSRIVDALYEHTLRQAQSDTYFGSLTCHAELVEASFGITLRQAQSDTYFSVLFPVMLSLSKHHPLIDKLRVTQ